MPSDVSCRDWGRVCWVWLGLVGIKSELGHSLTHKSPHPSFLPLKEGSHFPQKCHDWIPLASTILMTPHTSGSDHCRRRYRSCHFFVYSFYSPSKYSQSASILWIMGHNAYRWICLYKTSMTTVRTWKSVGWLQRNSWITFHLWEQPHAPYFIINIKVPPSSVVCSPSFLSLLGWGECEFDAEWVWVVEFLRVCWFSFEDRFVFLGLHSEAVYVTDAVGASI